LRTFYLLEVPLLQFRIFGDIREKSKRFTQIEDVFREECARSFQRMAESLENQLKKRSYDSSAPQSTLTLLETLQASEQTGFSEREVALMRMSTTIASLVDRMQSEVSLEPLYATE
jgi:multidrug resistance protein MdtO